LGDFLGTSGVELKDTIGGSGHGNVGPRLAVDVLDSVCDGPLELGAREDVLRFEGDRLDVATGDEH
jgi:hypothetical protein